MMYGFLIIIFLLSMLTNIFLANKNKNLRISRKKLEEFQHDCNSAFIAMNLAIDSLKDSRSVFTNSNDSKKYLSLLNILNECMTDIALNLEDLEIM